MPRSNLPRSVEDFVVEDSAETCLLWKKLLRVSMSIPMSCSMRTSCVPLRPRQDAAVLAGAASAMRSAAPSRSASVAPLLKRVRLDAEAVEEKSLSGSQEPDVALKSMLRSRSPSVAAVPTLRPSSEVRCVRGPRIPSRLLTMSDEAGQEGSGFMPSRTLFCGACVSRKASGEESSRLRRHSGREGR